MTMLILTVGVLAACSGQKTEGSSGEAAQTQAEGAEGSKGKTTVEFWHSAGGKTGDFLNDAIERFNESQDEIEVVGTFQGSYDDNVTKLQQGVAAGTAPDVTMLERAYVQMFAESDVLEDLQPHMEKTNLNVDDFIPGLMGHSIFNEQLVSLPLNRSTPILHVNKTMLDEQGLEIPQTWAELKDVANALVVAENGEFERYGLTMPYDTWYPIAMITQAEGKFFNDEGTSIGFDQGEGVKVFEFLKELQSTGALYYPPAKDSGNIANQMFVSGKVGLMFQSTGAIGGLLDSADFDYVTALLPKDEVYAAPTGGANIAMMKDSKNKEAAWEFVDWMMTDAGGSQQFIIDTGYLPITETMAKSPEVQAVWDEEPLRKTGYEQLEYAIDTNKHVAWPQVMQEFFKAIEAMMYDDEPIQPTLDAFKKEAERLLNS
ncbi:ABC transporter substrate-binding protein [Bacillaceae bacterium SIJ1]|nr:ABC transporter substrate-binding protein [Litoribacterium kuwaitense]